jgi:RNA-directed DNA polymerase
LAASLTSKSAVYHICHNLFLVKTPEQGTSGASCIEDFFDGSVRDMKLGNKTFNPSKQLDPAKEFGKVPFAEKIVLPNKDKIDFTNFTPIFDRIVAAIDHYKPPTGTP